MSMKPIEALDWYDKAVDNSVDYLCLDRDEMQDAYNTLFRAASKQEEVKPIKHDRSGDFYFWACPKCGAEWFENHVHQYCTDCGQRFDLSVWLKQEVE